MSEDIQSLINKFQENGVKKAEARRDEIIAAAEEEAKSLKAKAKAQAEKTMKEARDEADNLRNRAESAIRQAARDILLELERELERRINAAVAGAAEEALTPEFMAGLIKLLAEKFAADPDAPVSVLAAAKDAGKLETALRSALKASFKKESKVLAANGIRGGVEVSFGEGKLYFDFTSGAVTELVAEFIGPRLAGLVAEPAKPHRQHHAKAHAEADAAKAEGEK